MADIVALKLPDNNVYNVKDARVSKPVPADAVFTDHTYESKSAVSGGTDVSLVTTGEKYTWNSKSNLALGETSSTAYRGDRGKTAYNHSQLTSGNPHNVTASDVGAIASTLIGAANGVAELDSSGKVPSSQLPSYVDDVLEYASVSSFPSTGESGKIYIDLSTNLTYRWGGTGYVVISSSLALGETSSTAYRGDRGKIAYDHSQSTHARTDATKTESSTTNGNIKINGTETTVYTHPGSGTNPHGTTKSDVGLGNVGNFKAVSTAASQGLTSTEQANARANIGAGTSSLALGETSSTAYRGDRGKIAYDHSQSTHARTDATAVAASSTNGNIKINGTETTVYTHPGSGTNPHGTTKSDVGLGNVGTFKAVSTVASQGLTTTEKANARANIGAGTSSFSGSYNDLSNKPSAFKDLSATVSLPASSWNRSTLKLSATLSGTTTSTQIKNVALSSGALADYLKVVSAEISASNTITFTADSLPAANITALVTYA